MKNRHAAALAICASLLCGAAFAPRRAGAQSQGAQSQGVGTGEIYTAVVKGSEARFTLPVPQRPEWRWRRGETKDNGREYLMSVKVVNEGREFSFGLYLWKFPGAKEASGSFSSLIDAGQKSLFERTAAGRMTMIRDGGVRVKQDGQHLVITVGGRKNVARLFSGRPAEVRIETAILDETPTSQTVSVVYEN
ncbi:MAG TPA: hypothetical protein VGB98_26005 [Pyrinomonadaceae bacterium]|jgi:hypothetical protein